MKVREAGRIVPVAVTIAVGVNRDGRREVLGMAIGVFAVETFWLECLHSLARRGLRGVKLVISDAHEGLKVAVTKLLRATWQRCRVHFMRNAIAHASKTQHHAIVVRIEGASYCIRPQADLLPDSAVPRPLHQPDAAPRRPGRPPKPRPLELNGAA